MGMDFKEKIKRHIAGGYDFVNEVMELALSGVESEKLSILQEL